MTQEIQLTAQIPAEMFGKRLDQALAKMFPDYSRARLQEWVKSGQVTLDGQVPRAKDKVRGGEQVSIHAELEEDVETVAQDIPLNILFEDDEIIVLHKPAGLVVHPAAGNRDGTLQNALLFHRPELASLPRAGIVHRLDKDTSGLMVVAASLHAHKFLVDAMQARRIEREYEAVVTGVMTAGGIIDEPIGRHPVDRKRMAVRAGGKPAITHYRVLERFRAHTWIRVKLETGRTHQIRVHMAFRRYPIVGDPVYGGRLRIPPGCSEALDHVLRNFPRQALHAVRLALPHPGTGEIMEWHADLPEDMQHLLACLYDDREQHADK
jgi:23S rRNA pseudouridine1911/1915/1917 synthase